MFVRLRVSQSAQMRVCTRTFLLASMRVCASGDPFCWTDPVQAAVTPSHLGVALYGRDIIKTVVWSAAGRPHWAPCTHSMPSSNGHVRAVAGIFLMAICEIKVKFKDGKI